MKLLQQRPIKKKPYNVFLSSNFFNLFFLLKEVKFITFFFHVSLILAKSKSNYCNSELDTS